VGMGPTALNPGGMRNHGAMGPEAWRWLRAAEPPWRWAKEGRGLDRGDEGCGRVALKGCRGGLGLQRGSNHRIGSING
jgi:hypothetical protein